MENHFPIPVTAISSRLPHRPPAIWIDEVWSLSEAGGICRLVVRPNENGMNERGRVRYTTPIEWMAQSFAYLGACRERLHGESSNRSLQRAYLVGVKNFFCSGLREVIPGVVLEIEIQLVRELGPLSLINGVVRAANSEKNLANGTLKLFSE